MAKGTFAYGLGQVLNAGGQLVLVPILLSCWGKQLYGEWLVLSASVAYLTALDFGMQLYVINKLNQCYATKRMDEYTRVLHSGLLFSLVVPAVGLAISLPVLLLIPIESWLHLQAADRSTVVWVLVVLNIQAVFSIPLGMIGGIYRTINEFPRGQMFTNGRYMAWLLITATTVSLGGGLRAVALAQLILLFVLAVAMYYDLSRRHKELNLGLSRASLRLAFSFLGPSSMFLGIQVANVSLLQGTTILLSSLFGAGPVVVFVTLRTLANLVRQLTTMLHNPVWPEFSALEVRAERLALGQLHVLTAKLTVLAAVCSSIFILATGGRIVQLWTHGRVEYDAPLMFALLLYVCSQAYWMTSAILLSACNRQGIVLACSAGSTLAGLSAGYLLAPHFGLAGFALGLTGGDALISGILVPLFACWLADQRITEFFTEVTLRSVILTGGIYLGIMVVFRGLWSGQSGLTELFALALVVCILGALGAYLVSLNSRERGRLNLLFAGMLARS